MSNREFLIGVLTVLVFLVPSSAFAQIPDISQGDKLASNLNTVNSLIRMGDFERALAFLDHLKGLYGEQSNIMYLYKRVYQEAKMFPELEKVIVGQLSQDPGDQMLVAELGNVKFLLGDYDAADSLWDMALDSGGNNTTVYIAVATYKLHYGDYEGAIQAYLRGRAAIGSQTIFCYELANVYESQRKYPDAVGELLLYLSNATAKSRMVSSKIGGFLKDSDNRETVVKAVEDGAKRYEGNKEIQGILGEVYIKLGRMDRAFDTYRKLGSGEKDDGASLCEFAERCLDNMAYSTAIEAVNEYQRISKLKVFEDRALLIKGKAQRRAGLIDDAIVTLTSLSKSAGRRNISDEATYILGTIYSSDLEDCQSAISTWKRLAEQGSVVQMKEMATVEMASCYMRMDDFATAEILLAGMVDTPFGLAVNQKAVFLLGDLALMNGDYSRAKREYERLVGKNPGDEFANNALERLTVLSAAGFDSESEPGNELRLFSRAIKEMALGNDLKAADIFSDSSFESSPMAQIAVFYTGIIYKDAGDDADAISTLKKYINEFPDGFYVDRAYLNLGDLYLESKDTYPEARSAFDTILRDFPDGPVVEQARERLRWLESSEKIG